MGCGPKRLPRPPPSEKVVVAAGDIASCSGTADEATAGLVGGIEGATVLALGDEAYPAGTGGKSHYPISDPKANSEAHNDDTYGVLKLALRPKGYEWWFVPVGGRDDH